jgi:hypothetical protein
VNAAVHLKNVQARVLDKVFPGGDQEEVVIKHFLALKQLALGGVKVKVEIQALDKLGNGITVSVGFLKLN